MNPERTGVSQLKAIHIDLTDRSITFEAQGQSATKLTIGPEGISYELLSATVAPLRAEPTPITERAVEKLIDAAEEKEPLLTLTGRLKSHPVEGRRDGKGKPTAWARLAVHEEDDEGPHVYGATFHRHTAKVALTLPKEAQVTVQGYAHKSSDPSGKRLDTLSVINLVSYPGKPEQGQRDRGDTPAETR